MKAYRLLAATPMLCHSALILEIYLHSLATPD